MKLKYIYLSLAVLSAVSSCKPEFLDEELITTVSTESFKTKGGLDKLSVGMYRNLEYHFNYEWSYNLWQY